MNVASEKMLNNGIFCNKIMFFSEKGRRNNHPGVLILQALLSSLYLLKGALIGKKFGRPILNFESVRVHEKYYFYILSRLCIIAGCWHGYKERHCSLSNVESSRSDWLRGSSYPGS